MLRFGESPSRAGLYVMQACLELASAQMIEHDDDFPEDWVTDYPRTSQWCTRQAMQHVLDDILARLHSAEPVVDEGRQPPT